MKMSRGRRLSRNGYGFFFYIWYYLEYLERESNSVYYGCWQVNSRDFVLAKYVLITVIVSKYLLRLL